MSISVTELTLALVLSAACAHSAVIHSSFFDDPLAGNDGWRTGEMFQPTLSVDPTYVPTGGAAGGYIETMDTTSYHAFRAPESWLGDQSSLYGATLYFKLLTMAEMVRGNVPVVALLGKVDGANTILQWRGNEPGAGWTPYSVRLEQGLWEVGSGNGSAGPIASLEQIQGVLATLDSLAINADWVTGVGDVAGLDEVYITTTPEPTPIPEPASVLSWLSGLGVLIALGIRSRRRVG